ncbi:LuxR-family transcriptional regulator [Xenorhabdus nematophila ATCC 19061]|uniref:LuxR-family transcriptional regulator n=1 Tax=Xenorhabdus nematophila (strain ATCC 19061 / DSM 3370 / CCUG 14189 / LMG 1036 / NCIMB 9965 / AN6) TaxID=406817 RepID=D3VJX2_XENNA|nr:PAS and helix-turn-helix domain-containing protein [Xenorhabdus nematophila]CBJ91031.1 LuxR-family transcriptional regulator [Xenorhabdus nematophila ATCC 19061]CEE90386.1 LuxR-family transcriptional regulator [Xenorhabdus nematophila str. Anatoliense]CEE92345.1 LuxR-family transcriptional regulator [Xenorhabdus nematophila str. Anatoliense]CEK23851.1 LuxR-family transcriptional regulator [Xenorhabdus nematophila AN6/1]
MSLSCKNNESYLKGLVAMMEHLSDPWGIKDSESRHIYMNKAAYLYTNTPEYFDIEGKFDYEFPTDWSDVQFSQDLKEHDRRTKKLQDRVSIIETHYWYGKDSLAPFISEKYPVYSDDKTCIGIVWNAKPLNSLSPLKYINRQKPSVLTTEATINLFTQGELDIIFLMLQRHSSKEIAKIYNISHRTIENRIYNIYQKANVHSIQQFEEFCRHSQLDSYIPERLITKGILFI